MPRRRSPLAHVLLSLGVSATHLVRANASGVELRPGAVEVTDSLPAEAGAYEGDPVPWAPGTFEVRAAASVGAAPGGFRYAGRWHGFPSPHTAVRRADGAEPAEVGAWYLAPNPDAVPAGRRPPGLVIVHSIAPRMATTRPLAIGLADAGVAVLVVELPGFGSRERPGEGGSGVAAALNGTQAAADARRAGDVLLAISGCDPDDLSVMGVSLGTFGAATAASLDPFFKRCVLILGGGPAERVLFEGQLDAAFLRERVLATGIAEAEVRALLRDSDPWHRGAGFAASGTDVWLMDARADRVFPAGTGDSLAAQLNIPAERRWTFGGGHYTAIFVWPKVLAWVRGILLDELP